MGQRAVLLLSELLLLLLTASRTLLAVSFPEDNVPLDVVDAHCEYTHTRANELRRDKEEIIITANSLTKLATLLYMHFFTQSCYCC